MIDELKDYIVHMSCEPILTDLTNKLNIGEDLVYYIPIMCVLNKNTINYIKWRMSEIFGQKVKLEHSIVQYGVNRLNITWNKI